MERCLFLGLTLGGRLLLFVLILGIGLSFGILLCEIVLGQCVRTEGSHWLTGSDGMVQVLGTLRSHAYLKVCKGEVSTYAYCPEESLDYGNLTYMVTFHLLGKRPEVQCWGDRF